VVRAPVIGGSGAGALGKRDSGSPAGCGGFVPNAGFVADDNCAPNAGSLAGAAGTPGSWKDALAEGLVVFAGVTDSENCEDCERQVRYCGGPKQST
jgi:hypothetical protein